MTLPVSYDSYTMRKKCNRLFKQASFQACLIFLKSPRRAMKRLRYRKRIYYSDRFTYIDLEIYELFWSGKVMCSSLGFQKTTDEKDEASSVGQR